MELGAIHHSKSIEYNFSLANVGPLPFQRLLCITSRPCVFPVHEPQNLQHTVLL